MKSDSSASAQVITKYEQETKTQKDQAISIVSSLAAEESKFKKIVTNGTNYNKQITSTLEEARGVLETNKRHETEISETLRLASKYGMAASFKQRKDELKTSMIFWAVAFIISITGIFLTGVFYIFPNVSGGTLPPPPEIIVKVTLITPLIWLGWMAAKQYGYLSKIREDYSFKYASALAFEGYKKEASDLDKVILEDLIKVATRNMALNPLRIYEGDPNHASPFNELIAKMFDRPRDKSNPKEGEN